jgi:hypothetical protein
MLEIVQCFKSCRHSDTAMSHSKSHAIDQLQFDTYNFATLHLAVLSPSS